MRRDPWQLPFNQAAFRITEEERDTCQTVALSSYGPANEGLGEQQNLCLALIHQFGGLYFAAFNTPASSLAVALTRATNYLTYTKESITTPLTLILSLLRKQNEAGDLLLPLTHRQQTLLQLDNDMDMYASNCLAGATERLESLAAKSLAGSSFGVSGKLRAQWEASLYERFLTYARNSSRLTFQIHLLNRLCLRAYEENLLPRETQPTAYARLSDTDAGTDLRLTYSDYVETEKNRWRSNAGFMAIAYDFVNAVKALLKKSKILHHSDGFFPFVDSLKDPELVAMLADVFREYLQGGLILLDTQEEVRDLIDRCMVDIASKEEMPCYEDEEHGCYDDDLDIDPRLPLYPDWENRLKAVCVFAGQAYLKRPHTREELAKIDVAGKTYYINTSEHVHLATPKDWVVIADKQPEKYFTAKHHEYFAKYPLTCWQATKGLNPKHEGLADACKEKLPPFPMPSTEEMIERVSRLRVRSGSKLLEHQIARIMIEEKCAGRLVQLINYYPKNDHYYFLLLPRIMTDILSSGPSLESKSMMQSILNTPLTCGDTYHGIMQRKTQKNLESSFRDIQTLFQQILIDENLMKVSIRDLTSGSSRDPNLISQLIKAMADSLAKTRPSQEEIIAQRSIRFLTEKIKHLFTRENIGALLTEIDNARQEITRRHLLPIMVSIFTDNPEKPTVEQSTYLLKVMNSNTKTKKRFVKSVFATVKPSVHMLLLIIQTEGYEAEKELALNAVIKQQNTPMRFTSANILVMLNILDSEQTDSCYDTIMPMLLGAAGCQEQVLTEEASARLLLHIFKEKLPHRAKEPLENKDGHSTLVSIISKIIKSHPRIITADHLITTTQVFALNSTKRSHLEFEAFTLSSFNEIANKFEVKHLDSLLSLAEKPSSPYQKITAMEFIAALSRLRSTLFNDEQILRFVFLALNSEPCNEPLLRAAASIARSSTLDYFFSQLKISLNIENLAISTFLGSLSAFNPSIFTLDHFTDITQAFSGDFSKSYSVRDTLKAFLHSVQASQPAFSERNFSQIISTLNEGESILIHKTATDLVHLGLCVSPGLFNRSHADSLIHCFIKSLRAEADGRHPSYGDERVSSMILKCIQKAYRVKPAIFSDAQLIALHCSPFDYFFMSSICEMVSTTLIQSLLRSAADDENPSQKTSYLNALARIYKKDPRRVNEGELDQFLALVLDSTFPEGMKELLFALHDVCNERIELFNSEIINKLAALYRAPISAIEGSIILGVFSKAFLENATIYPEKQLIEIMLLLNTKKYSDWNEGIRLNKAVANICLASVSGPKTLSTFLDRADPTMMDVIKKLVSRGDKKHLSAETLMTLARFLDQEDFLDKKADIAFCFIKICWFRPEIFTPESLSVALDLMGLLSDEADVLETVEFISEQIDLNIFNERHLKSLITLMNSKPNFAPILQAIISITRRAPGCILPKSTCLELLNYLVVPSADTGNLILKTDPIVHRGWIASMLDLIESKYSELNILPLVLRYIPGLITAPPLLAQNTLSGVARYIGRTMPHQPGLLRWQGIASLLSLLQKSIERAIHTPTANDLPGTRVANLQRFQYIFQILSQAYIGLRGHTKTGKNTKQAQKINAVKWLMGGRSSAIDRPSPFITNFGRLSYIKKAKCALDVLEHQARRNNITSAEIPSLPDTWRQCTSHTQPEEAAPGADDAEASASSLT